MSSLLNRRIPRPSAALVVAFAAMFTALGGTGYAALKITSASVVNNSLTGVDIKNASLGEKELKPDGISGARVKESSLGTVPSAQHAATADSAANATKAADADTLDGIDSAALMTKKPRLFEASFADNANFGNNATIGTLPDVPAGDYLVTAKFTYFNDGAVAQEESCTLNVPGSNDVTTIYPGAGRAQTVVLQEAVSTPSSFMASVSCTADADDDMLGVLSIIAVRVD